MPPVTAPIQAVFVLVRPQYAGNLGAVARVLRNFGQRELRLVSPLAPWNEEARRVAVGADRLVEEAPRFQSLGEAVADLQWTVATASLRGRGRKESEPLRQAIPGIIETAAANRVGFVFGPEDSGLTGQELGLCRSLVHVPTRKTSPTLNLAQAVAIVAYELFVAAVPQGTSRALACSASMEGLFAHLREALLEIGFLQQNNPERMLEVLRRILSRTELSEEEVTVMRGICRQVLWASRRK